MKSWILIFFLLAAPVIAANAEVRDSIPVPAAVDADTVAPHVPLVHTGGKYIYVPDSLAADVLLLLKGHSKVVDDFNRLDPEEKTIFRGDTIPMVVKSLKLGRYDRGLSNLLFVPKGIWSIGMTASYGELGTEDLGLFDLVSDVDIRAYSFSIKPYIQYYIRNNMAVGLKFGYYNAKGNVDSFGLNIDDDLNFNLRDIEYRSESYSAAATLTQFIGLGRRSRFGVFNEIELAFKSGNSEFTRPIGGNLRTTYTTSSDVQLNFSPGVQVFVMKQVAFHVSFGVFGFNFRNEKQREDDGTRGSRFSSGANFRFNIFNINFGIAVNF